MKKEEKKHNYTTIEENLYIFDEVVQKHNGLTIWLEVKKDLKSGKIISRRKIVYMPVPNKSCKRIYI